ncbi:bifunctional D-cysteine desulfhydrase/1-aminocyclopropane-1-carboxylate deaminase, mitochondrial [Quercus robur]|uniref:bifunctional D-cysteine desulfhydrase/1-aminocyclopropane-1-carboxylate deaminase, mitochondrial n=1 Tax=Quercus robur TaxID=38942 RepID=UPI002163EB71|nr:bifunctional D-cysteine desulfhydrase/1-aminocyclopropane-1-carboxylate deaminase, mitochondrial [Quercus robur]
MLCSSSRRWAVRPLSHPNRMNKILLLFFRPQRLSFSSSSSSSRTNIILKSQSESETHINTIIMEDEVSKQQQKQATRGSMEFLSSKPYVPPQWASHLNPIPSHIFSLAHLPTPIHKWNLPNLPNNTEVWLKRDDLSGMQLSGNKVRKLEFLMAEAVAQGADCVITIGGIQSNHCRATAVAAKYLHLDCFIILRTSKVLVDKDPGLTGNLLVERLVGAHVDLISKEEYAKLGSVTLTNLLKEKLLNEGRRPYVIPVGGSNSLGTWGYIEAIREIEQQLQIGTSQIKFDDIVVACGSGGTIAGLSLGSWLSTLKSKVHAFSVCDDPDYFYDFVQGLLDGLEAGVDSHDIVNIKNAKGLGYAINTPEELKFVKEVASATGVVLDPVYSGKAAYGMIKDMTENPKKWEGRKILFIHTGGLLGLFDKIEEMNSLVGNWSRMDVHEDIPRKDGIGKMF